MTNDARLNGISDSMNMNLSKLQKIVKDSEGWSAVVHAIERAGHDHQLNNHPCKEITIMKKKLFKKVF